MFDTGGGEGGATGSFSFLQDMTKPVRNRKKMTDLNDILCIIAEFIICMEYAKNPLKFVKTGPLTFPKQLWG